MTLLTLLMVINTYYKETKVQFLKYLNKCMLVLTLLLASAQLMAWPAALDFNADIGNGDVSGNQIIHNINTTDILLRCDAAKSSWEGEAPTTTPPEQCHRWGLIWKPVSYSLNTLKISSDDDELEDYHPDADIIGDNWRLPTIKELTRLFNYEGTVAGSTVTNNGITGNPVLVEWLSETTVADGFLISSSYRNISGDAGVEDKRNQIFVIKVSNGRILTATPGRTDTSQSMKLCLGMTTDGSTVKGKCERELAANFYALKVRTQTASELGYN
jgi:hypothetical protein